MTTETKPFDPTKSVQTRDGCPARIICTDQKHELYPIVALVDRGNRESMSSYTKEGKWHVSDVSGDRDLINIPETKSSWCILFVNPDSGSLYVSRDTYTCKESVLEELSESTK